MSDRETTAILVDGGFYRYRAHTLFGDKPPAERADELVTYCMRHIHRLDAKLYRIFYYDCPPSTKAIFHPLLQKNINLGKTNEYTWMTTFLHELQTKRKLAVRRGEILESQIDGYTLRFDAVKALLAGRKTVADLTAHDFTLSLTQKGVDMKLGLDIASLASKRQVTQIVLIAGDSDFVPAAKYARREGIDFILDPMWHPITDSLNEHIDGLESAVKKPPENIEDPLCELQMHENEQPSTAA